MDYFAHGFWSYIFFNKTERPLYAVLFGLLPDSLSWLIYTVYKLFMSSEFGKPVLNNIPAWVFILYDISHSLVVALIVISIVYFSFYKVPVYIWAWPIAIVMDIFTHSRNFLPTPFLWPISDWKFPGIRWGTKTFMMINYSLILISFLYIIFKRNQKNNNPIH